VGWTVVRRLGRGATGVVELAVGPDGRPVARKRLALHGSAPELDDARHRIRREADVLRRLDHPAIVPLLDVETDGDDVVLVMPYYEGGTLADRVASDGPLPADAVLALSERLVGALAAAHRAGIVHRDVKPQNVLFDAGGDAFLADFGVARASDVTTGLTGDGVVVGTPAYMAPEQARGEPAGPASDVFALGATLLFALTGRGPWGDGPAAAAFARASRGRADLGGVRGGDVPASLRRRLRAMLDREPRRRPSAAALAGGPHGTGGATARRRRPRPARRSTAVRAGVGIAVVVIALVAALVVVDRGDDRGKQVAAAPGGTTPCHPLPYQPCGGAPVAPYTDGRACIDDHADYDGITTNGCEAAPDTADGTAFVNGRSLHANLVPGTDVDRYPMRVDDRFQLLCDGELRVTLTAPANVAQRVRILDPEGDEVAKAVSGDGVPATAKVGDPNCLFDDGGTYVAEVSVVSGNSATDYELTRAGSL
jgi:tRNA A-37 threonylcarbamoyl transferase component Bud32